MNCAEADLVVTSAVSAITSSSANEAGVATIVKHVQVALTDVGVFNTMLQLLAQVVGVTFRGLFVTKIPRGECWEKMLVKIK